MAGLSAVCPFNICGRRRSQ